MTYIVAYTLIQFQALVKEKTGNNRGDVNCFLHRDPGTKKKEI
jgi:hypothetical protein